jgi:hypothetical protein
MRAPLVGMAACLLLAFGASCHAPLPPAHWQQGGAVVSVPRAQWVRYDTRVDLMPDGSVLVDGEHRLTIDAAGRVYDTESRPVALLEPDGRVVGPDDQDLGLVGAVTASLPGQRVAWLGIQPDGQVQGYSGHDIRQSLGTWLGCNVSPQAQQVCVLVTHLFAMKLRGQGSGLVWEFGVGARVGP